jgi:amino acid adenylation domain-containing protein
VGVLLDRRFPFVLAQLAIWKSGGVYLPLDPLHPQERLAQILEESHCRVVLSSQTYQSLWEEIAGQGETPLLLIEQLLREVHEGLEMHGEARSLPQARLVQEPGQQAYVLYTSGSTGQPKGVMVEQRGMLNHLLAKSEDLGLSGADIVAQNGPQSFDIAIWQSVGALLWGGQVRLVPEEIAFEAKRLWQEVREHGITILQVVPALLRELVQELEEEERAQRGVVDVGAVRWVVPTGEALPGEVSERWSRLAGGVPLLNTYGSTECSDDQCHYGYEQLAGEEAELAIVPLGYPIRNMQGYVVDAQGEQVPVGVRGELWLGGRGVGRGYIGRPEQTAERFVPDRWSGEAGSRLYRTGDVVRRLKNGNLEYVGRKDHLVKVRGYRIELGEIEAVLAECEGVEASVVVAREGSRGEQELIGYVVMGRGKECSEEEVRGYVRKRLPEYMVPRRCVQLEELPLTSNGKVDRKALPEPEEEESSETERREERGRKGEIEELVGAIWGEVLEREEIGREENFFALGGHSLLATRVMARVRGALGVELPLRSLFEWPTVAGLALHIEQILRSEQGIKKPALKVSSGASEIPLSFAQQRLWFLHQLDPHNPAYNIPGGIRIRGKLNVQALFQSLNVVVQRHGSLRTAFQDRYGRAIQVIEPRGKLSMLSIDVSHLDAAVQEKELRRLVQDEAHCPFNLAQGPLLRCVLLRLHADEHVLALTMHHIISDGWSSEVLIRELTTLYEAFVAGRSAPLPPLPVQYADFALWQRSWLKDEALDTLLDYWTQQLRGATALELAKDRARQGSVQHRGATHTFMLSQQLSRALHTLSQQEGVTLFMALLGAFQVLLYRVSGQRDIVVGTDVANRTYEETEALIGFFVNLLALRMQLHGQDTFREIAKGVRTMVLNAYAHQDLPFEKLIDALQLERSGQQVPLVNILFVMQNTLPPLHLQDLEVSAFDIEIQTAKFDLAVFMMERLDGLHGFVNYRADLFDHETIAQLFKHFEILLESIVRAPDASVDTLEIFTPEEKAQLLNRETTERAEQRRKLKVTKRRVIALADADKQERG